MSLRTTSGRVWSVFFACTLAAVGAHAESLTVTLAENPQSGSRNNVRIRIYDESRYSGGSLNAPIAQLLKRGGVAGGESFTFSTLPVGRYVILAFEDANANYTLDDGELIAISNTGNPDLRRLPAFAEAAVSLVPGGSEFTINLP